MKVQLQGLEKLIRQLLWMVIAGLLLSGITAFPIESELSLATALIDLTGLNNSFTDWIVFVHNGVASTYSRFPFIAYGTDWLAFAHLLLAVLFLGPLRDPLRNIWVVEFGIIASIAIVPLATIAGHFRGIPIFWQLIDCSFGIICGSVLWICHSKIKQLARLQHSTKQW